jgi:hypothetical protein
MVILCCKRISCGTTLIVSDARVEIIVPILIGTISED